jgi:DNA-binding NarL/FixJ family response regulator
VAGEITIRQPQVCGEAVNLSQTLYLAATLQPDVILLDLHMPDGDTFESAFVKLRLLSIGSRILAMSLWQDEETQIIAQDYGAVELLDKGELFNELIPAIQRVSQ